MEIQKLSINSSNKYKNNQKPVAAQPLFCEHRCFVKTLKPDDKTLDFSLSLLQLFNIIR